MALESQRAGDIDTVHRVVSRVADLDSELADHPEFFVADVASTDGVLAIDRAPFQMIDESEGKCYVAVAIEARGDSALASCRPVHRSAGTTWQIMCNPSMIDASADAWDAEVDRYDFDQVRSTYTSVGGDGQDTLVAVIDNGIDSTLLKREVPNAIVDDLPLRSGHTIGLSLHGTWMASLVHQIAPAACLIDVPARAPRFRYRRGRIRYEDARSLDFVRQCDAFLQSVRRNREQGSLARAVACAACYVDASELSDDEVDSLQSPLHPLVRIGEAFARNGVEAVFAAGNCCSDTKITDVPVCGIIGVAAQPTVITVGACDSSGTVLPYSLHKHPRCDSAKPDVLAFSNFTGRVAGRQGKRKIWRSDLCRGTSASTALVAGLVARLQSSPAPIGLRSWLNGTQRGDQPMPLTDPSELLQ